MICKLALASPERDLDSFKQSSENPISVFKGNRATSCAELVRETEITACCCVSLQDSQCLCTLHHDIPSKRTEWKEKRCKPQLIHEERADWTGFSVGDGMQANSNCSSLFLMKQELWSRLFKTILCHLNCTCKTHCYRMVLDANLKGLKKQLFLKNV